MGSSRGESMARFQNTCMETDAVELVDIWCEVMSYSSAFGEVAIAINESDSDEGGIMARCHIRR